jgi:hypothetical protein
MELNNGSISFYYKQFAPMVLELNVCINSEPRRGDLFVEKLSEIVLSCVAATC